MRIIIFLVFFFISSQVWATTWWVRDGGGSYGNSSTTCNGLTNAVYTSGNGPNCAVSNPMFILGAGCGNFGFGPCNVANLMVGGDTLNIDGDSDINPGSQAQYPIGYDSTGIITPSNSSNCTAGGSLNCTTGNPPAGSSGSPTTIQTTPGSTHKAQLWGREKVNQVLEADASYVLLNNLEITDHSACIYGSPAAGNIGSYPRSCNSSSSPYGNYGIDGVFYGGTGSEMENMWIHGMSHDGTQSDNLVNWKSINNIIAGNAFNGDAPGDLYGSSGTVSYTGTNTWQNDEIVYNGCGEIYPMHSSNPYDTANYHDCWDQANGGQGDGLGTQADFSTCNANFYFIDDDISFNTQDGIDFLHCNSLGNAYVYRTRTEGNEGQAIKLNQLNDYAENDLIIGDCYYHNSANPIDLVNSNGFNNCRAGGDCINMILAGGIYSIDNSTVLCTGPGMQDAGASSSTCAGTINWYNDNVIGGYETPVYGNSQLATWIDRECSGGSYTFNEDYNHVWNTNNQAQCGSSPGTHDQCNDNSGAVTTTLTTSMIGPIAYYQGNDLGHLLYPASGGLLPSNANNSLSLTGTSNDFNSVARQSSTYTVGDYTLNSCVATGGTCFETNECCGGASCTGNVCGGAPVCSANGLSCSSNGSCCSGICCSSICASSCGGGIPASVNPISGDVYQGKLVIKGVVIK